MGANSGFAADGRVDFFQYDPTQYSPFGNAGMDGSYDASGINPYTNGTLAPYMSGGGYDPMPSMGGDYAPGNAWSNGYDPYGSGYDTSGINPYTNGALIAYGDAYDEGGYAPGNAWSTSYDPYGATGTSYDSMTSSLGGSFAVGNAWSTSCDPYGSSVAALQSVGTTAQAQTFSSVGYSSYNSYNTSSACFMPSPPLCGVGYAMPAPVCSNFQGPQPQGCTVGCPQPYPMMPYYASPPSYSSPMRTFG